LRGPNKEDLELGARSERAEVRDYTSLVDLQALSSPQWLQALKRTAINLKALESIGASVQALEVQTVTSDVLDPCASSQN
jgi:hypothetical protein